MTHTCLNCKTNYETSFVGVSTPCACRLCIPDKEALRKAIAHYEDTLLSLKQNLKAILGEQE